MSDNSHEWNEAKQQILDAAVNEFADRGYSRASMNHLVKSAGISKEELDWLVPHQANIRIIQATAKRLDLPMEKVIVTVQDHGNTSAASIPIALDQMVREDRLQGGDYVMLVAFGGGLTWGATLIRW